MAYEPLHLKYRPQRFADVVGQAAVVKTLANAIRLNRIAPAYLFCGPRGTGKTSSARILAKSLNCVQGPTPDPCNVCDQCRSITNGSSLDVIEIDAASNTGVDNIRELIERAQFAPVSSRYKVYVLDEVHMLSTAAFNALLKTLEEPPAHVVFVLATTDPQRVLPTVISRCQRFDYRRIALEDMIAHLTKIAWAEEILITGEAIQLIAQLAQGGLRDAESMLDQLSLLDSEITVESVWDLVGAVPEQQLLHLIDAIQHQDPEQVLAQARQLLDQGKEPLTLLQNLVSFYRDLLLAKTAPDRQDLVALTQPTWEALHQRSSQYSVAAILAAQHHLRQTEPQVRQTNQPRLWLEIGLLDLQGVIHNSSRAEPTSGSTHPPTPVTSSTVRSDLPPPAPNTTETAQPRGQVIRFPTLAQADVPSDHSREPVSKPPSTQPSRSASEPVPRGSVDPSSQPQSDRSLVTNRQDPGAQPVAGTMTTLTGCWQEFLNRLPPLAKGLGRLGHIVQETDHEIELGFPSPKFAEKARDQINSIQPVVNQLLGRQVKLKFVSKIQGNQPTSPKPSAPQAFPSPDRNLSTHPDPNPRPSSLSGTPDRSISPTRSDRSNGSVGSSEPTDSFGSVEPRHGSAPSLPASPPNHPPQPFTQSHTANLRSANPNSYNRGGDELDQAARRFAEFFNGVLINMHEGDDLPPALTEAPLDPLFESSSGDLNLDPPIEPIPQPAIQPEILPPDRIDLDPPSSPATALDDEDELPF